MSDTVHLGFEVGTGKAVEIPIAHMVVTGMTQLQPGARRIRVLSSRVRRSISVRASGATVSKSAVKRITAQLAAEPREKLIEIIERQEREIETVRTRESEGASLVRRMSAERAPLQAQLQTDHEQITGLVKLLRVALSRCRSDDPLRPEIEAALKAELWQAPASSKSPTAKEPA